MFRMVRMVMAEWWLRMVFTCFHYPRGTCSLVQAMGVQPGRPANFLFFSRLVRGKVNVTIIYNYIYTHEIYWNITTLYCWKLLKSYEIARDCMSLPCPFSMLSPLNLPGHIKDLRECGGSFLSAFHGCHVEHKFQEFEAFWSHWISTSCWRRSKGACQMFVCEPKVRFEQVRCLLLSD